MQPDQPGSQPPLLQRDPEGKGAADKEKRQQRKRYVPSEHKNHLSILVLYREYGQVVLILYRMAKHTKRDLFG